MKQNNQERRIFLQALSVCLASASVASLAATPTGRPSNAVLDRFLKAASGLTGLNLTNRDLAVIYLGVLRARFTQSNIDSLLATVDLDVQAFSIAVEKTPLKNIAQQAILLWLTGMSIDPATGTSHVLAYSEAAVWAALPFTKPPGQCGGLFGYWSEAPLLT